MIQWDCAGLDLENPKNWRGRSCTHLVIDGQHVQIDAGPEFRLACIKNNVPAVDYFFLTHEHSDHMLGMEDLRRYCDLRHGEAIPIYTTAPAAERVKLIFNYGIRERAQDGYIAFKPIVAGKDFTLPAGTRVQTALLPHSRTVSTLGIVFTEKSTGKKLAYFTDCASVPEEAAKLAQDADVLVIDGLRPTPHPTHLSVPGAVEAAQKMHAKKTFLIHLTWQIDHATWSEKLPAGVELSYDGLRVNV